MASRSSAKSKMDKEREKVIQDRLQVLLTQMLKDDDNKYCVDCDAKGPRWASWNLGIFLCIRCAGIHRNLGVHISKVRSVNLDSWNPLQVSSMQLMGNSRARAVYEANLPDGFLRPQNDQALEQFIRAKYEKKKYIAKEYVPSKPPDFPEGWHQLIEAEKQKKDIRKLVLPSHTHTNAAKAPTPTEETARPKVDKSPQVGGAKKVAPPVVPKSAADDLLGLGIGAPTSSANASASSEADFLGLGNTSNNGGFEAFVSAPPPASSTTPAASPAVNKATTAATNNNGHGASKEENDFFAQTGSAASTPQQAPRDDGKMSKDSIMALFAKSPASSSPRPQQPAGANNGMFGNVSGANMFGSPNGFQQQQQRPAGMFGNGSPAQPGAFGVNPQSNPFLSQPAANRGMNGGFGNQMGGMTSFGNGAAINQANSNVAAMTGGMGGLNLGQGFSGIPLDPASNKPPGQTNQNSASADILGLW